MNKAHRFIELQKYKIQLPQGLHLSPAKKSVIESESLIRLQLLDGGWLHIAKTSGTFTGISSLLIERIPLDPFPGRDFPIEFISCGRDLDPLLPRRIRLRSEEGKLQERFWPIFYSQKDEMTSLLEIDNNIFKRIGFLSPGKIKLFEIAIETIFQHFSVYEEKGLYINPKCKSLFPHIFIRNARKLELSSLKILACDLFVSKEEENNCVTLFYPLLEKLQSLEKKTKRRKSIKKLMNDITNKKITSITKLYSRYQRMIRKNSLPIAKIYLDIANIDTSLYPYRYTYKNISRIVAIRENAEVQGNPYGVLIQQIGKWKENLKERINYFKSVGVDIHEAMVKGDKANQKDDIILAQKIEKDLSDDSPVKKVILFTGDGGFVEKIDKMREKGIGNKTSFIFVYVPGTNSSKIGLHYEERNIWEYIKRENLEV